nr:chorismate-binding protein [Paenibacillus sp. RC67]
MEDADQVRKLLNSAKDEAELTMCTDVDRNDKSRICEPGTVQVIGRRQLEMYSHLIHTVDHIEGTLAEPFDALDAFMTHMWAVTVTGAPKRAAIQWIENHEDSPRGWYGGAVGFYTFNGHLNTGLTLRTMKIAEGRAEVRVGATLLYDSDPMEEEQEILTKGAALFQTIRGSVITWEPSATMEREQPGAGKRVLVIDHEDSFVHTLASYFRQTGAQVMTVRWNYAHKLLEQPQEQFDCIILSPGPGRPADFRMVRTLDMCVARKVPILGVCLGLQGLVEYYGGTLQVLSVPQHGKSSVVNLTQPSLLWNGIQDHFQVGRYHSLYAADVPDCLKVTAISEDGIVMAVEHKQAPLYAVQFHPESILSLKGEAGYQIIRNFLSANPAISQNAQ